MVAWWEVMAFCVYCEGRASGSADRVDVGEEPEPIPGFGPEQLERSSCHQSRWRRLWVKQLAWVGSLERSRVDHPVGRSPEIDRGTLGSHSLQETSATGGCW